MSYLNYYNNGFDFSFGTNPIYYAGALLVASNFLVYSMMSVVYLLGKESMLSNLFIYGPITGIITTSVRDKYSFTFVLSSTLAAAHGVAHVVYPFLDEDIGVNRSIDVWQDQFLHLGQSVLFSSIFLDNSSLLFTVYSFAFMLGNLLNVVLGYNCWGESCHDLYVWVSLLPALSTPRPIGGVVCGAVLGVGNNQPLALLATCRVAPGRPCLSVSVPKATASLAAILPRFLPLNVRLSLAAFCAAPI